MDQTIFVVRNWHATLKSVFKLAEGVKLFDGQSPIKIVM